MTELWKLFMALGSIATLVLFTLWAGVLASRPVSAVASGKVLDPEVVITRFAAPCKSRATWNSGRLLWLCDNGDIYEAPLK